MNFTNTLRAIIEASSPRFDANGPDVIEHNGRFFVNMGRPGFNTRANNGSGYATHARAFAVIVKHSKR